MTLFFRILSALEGISLLIILSVTLGLISREFVSILGMTHGVIFMIYSIVTIIFVQIKKLSLMMWLALFLSAFIPFGFIAVDFLVRKKEKQN